NYMFGSILAMSKEDLWLSVVLSVNVLAIYVLFYNKIFAVTFDENFAKATGTRTGIYNMLIAFLTAITIVLGMRLMGSMLISSLIIFPSLSAMRLFKSFRGVVIVSAIISIFSFIAGIVISYMYGSPAGASVVTVNIAVFVVFYVVGSIIGRSRRA
nr:metal ABC transporter permease [Clostridia bacterium]